MHPLTAPEYITEEHEAQALALALDFALSFPLSLRFSFCRTTAAKTSPPSGLHKGRKMDPPKNMLLGDFSKSLYFVKKEFDGEGGENGVGGIDAYYFEARMYDSEIGMFLSTDPMAEFWNSYSYVGGNPILYVDPTGMTHEISQEEWEYRNSLANQGGSYNWDVWDDGSVGDISNDDFYLPDGSGSFTEVGSMGWWGYQENSSYVNQEMNIGYMPFSLSDDAYVIQGGQSGQPSLITGNYVESGGRMLDYIPHADQAALSESYKVLLFPGAIKPNGKTMSAAYNLAQNLYRDITITEGYDDRKGAHGKSAAFDLGNNNNKPYIQREVMVNAYRKSFDVKSSMAIQETGCYHFQTISGKGNAVGFLPGLRDKYGKLVSK